MVGLSHPVSPYKAMFGTNQKQPTTLPQAKVVQNPNTDPEKAKQAKEEIIQLRKNLKSAKATLYRGAESKTVIFPRWVMSLNMKDKILSHFLEMIAGDCSRIQNSSTQEVNYLYWIQDPKGLAGFVLADGSTRNKIVLVLDLRNKTVTTSHQYTICASEDREF